MTYIQCDYKPMKAALDITTFLLVTGDLFEHVFLVLFLLSCGTFYKDYRLLMEHIA